MAEVVRDLLRSFYPAYSKQGHLELIDHDCVQLAFACLQGWELHSLSGQSAWAFDHPHSQTLFPSCSSRVFCISVCSWCPFSFHWSLLRKAYLHLLYSTHLVFIPVVKLPHAFPSPGGAVPALSDSYMTDVPNLSSSLCYFTGLVTSCLGGFLICWGAYNPPLPDSAEQREGITSLDLLTRLCLV